MAPLLGRVWVYDLSVRKDPSRCEVADQFVRFYAEGGRASMVAGSRQTQEARPASIVAARRQGDLVILSVADRSGEPPAEVEVRLLKDGTIGMRRGSAKGGERRLAPCPLRRRDGDVPQS
jgi:hypothetical protein